MKRENIPYYDVSSPYDIVYRNEKTVYPVGPHMHNAAEIYLTLTFLEDALLDDRISEVPAGSLIIIPPFCVHQLYHKNDVVHERYILSVQQEWIEKILFGAAEPFSYLKAGAVPIILTLNETQRKELVDLFKRAFEDKNGTAVDSIVNLLILLKTIDMYTGIKLTQKKDRNIKINETQKHVNEMISYINEHLADRLEIKDLADHFFLNRDYLSRLFKQHTHTSVAYYISLQRITKAQAMLKDGHSISEVQETLGYSSYAHFAKTFKKLTGMTPGQYKGMT